MVLFPELSGLKCLKIAIINCKIAYNFCVKQSNKNVTIWVVQRFLTAGELSLQHKITCHLSEHTHVCLPFASLFMSTEKGKRRFKVMNTS